MAELAVLINGRPYTVPRGTTVAAAMLRAGAVCRVSVSGAPRAPLCGMGICYECRAVVNGVPQQRTCQLPCAHGMVIATQTESAP